MSKKSIVTLALASSLTLTHPSLALGVFGHRSTLEKLPFTFRPKPKLVWTFKNATTQENKVSSKILILPKDSSLNILKANPLYGQIQLKKSQALNVDNTSDIERKLHKAFQKYRSMRVGRSKLSINLQWKNCNSWKIDHYESTIDGVALSPEHSLKHPIDFTIKLSERREIKSLCNKESNIASPESVKSAQEEISAHHE